MVKKYLMIVLIFALTISFVSGANLYVDMNMNAHNINNVTNLTAVRFIGDGSYLTGIDAEVNNITVGISADASCGCANRLLTSEASATYSVYGNDSIQDIICGRLPYLLRHRITINVYSNYTRNESICIPPYIGEQSTDYNGGQLRIRGNDGEWPKINGIFASGIIGQAQPYFYGLNITGYHPYYTGKCQICLFGVGTCEMYNMHFSGNPTYNVYGVTSYGGNVKVSDVVFENGTQYAIETKQGGKALVMNVTGAVTNTPFYASTGQIIIDYRGYSNITGGVQRYKRLAGTILEQQNSGYTMQKEYGTDSIDTLENVGALKTNFTINSTNTIVTNLYGSDINVSNDLTVADDAQIRQLFVNCQGSSCSRDLEVNSSAGGIRLRSEAADAWGSTISLMKKGNTSSISGIPATDATMGYLKYSVWNGSTYKDSIEVTGFVAQTVNTTSFPGYLVFNLIPIGSSTLREVFRVTDQGIDYNSFNYNACTSANEGVITYNATLRKHVGCNSTSWNPLY